MKKLLAILLALGLVLGLAACGGDTDTDDPGQETDTRSLVYLTSTLGDMGFLDNAWDGIQRLASENGYTAQAIEMGADSSAYEAAFLDALDSGKYDVFFSATTGGMGDLMVKYAAEYPEYRFVLFDVGRTFEVPTDNMAAVTFLQNEGAYLGGVLAASLSKTGKIGIYLHTDSPVLNDFATGFYQGASDINPDIVIYTAYGAGVSGDSARSAELTSIMFNNGADVVFGAAGSSNPGLFQNVLDLGGFDAGYYAIGVDYDQWYKYINSNTPEMADAIVSSVVKHVGESLVTVWNGLEDGSLQWGELAVFGINEDCVGVAQNEYYLASVPADIQAVVTDHENRVKNGEIAVRTYFDFADHDEFLEYQAQYAV